MPARNRCLCQSRVMIWLTGLVIQLKRAGLAIRRFSASLVRAFAWLMSLVAGGLRWLWTSLFLPAEEYDPPTSQITSLEPPSENPFAPTPRGESFQRLRTLARSSSLQARRAGLRIRRACQKRTAWTFATVTGSLGILLMIVLQVMYSFQTLSAKPSPVVAHALEENYPKTRIDPGMPQGREQERHSMEIAQIDPFAPAEPDPFSAPPEAAPLAPWEPEPLFDPLDDLPPLEPIPAEPIRQPRSEPVPWVDPLDDLPSFNPLPSELESQPPVDLDPLPIELEPEPPVELDPLPDPTPLPPREELPRNERKPWVDPLDDLPSFNPLPSEPEPAPRPSVLEPEHPPRVPEESDMGIGFLRMPKDDGEGFLLQSGRPIHRENLSRELEFDAWERYLEQERRGPVPPRPYWERLSLEERQRLEQDLIPMPSRTEYDPGPQEPRADLKVGIEKHLPPRGTAHEPIKYEIVVENRGREMIDAVDVDEVVPPTHQLTDVSPAGFFEDHLLRWRLRELQPGERRRLSVEVVPSETGTVETTTSVRPSARVGSLTQVEKSAALLKLSLTAPERVRVGEPCPLVFRVMNTGTQDAENVVVRQQLPDGLSHQMGRDLELVIGRLPAGTSREARLIPVAKKTGPIENLAEVSADNQVLDSATTRTEVFATTLRLRRSGYKTVSLEESVLFTNHVRNLSDTLQREVKIVEQIPAGFRVLRVEEDGVYDRQSQTITWRLAALPPGETAKLGVHLQAESIGELQSRVKGSTSEGEAVPIRARVRVDRIPTGGTVVPATRGSHPGRCPSCGCRCCCAACRCQ